MCTIDPIPWAFMLRFLIILVYIYIYQVAFKVQVTSTREGTVTGDIISYFPLQTGFPVTARARTVWGLYMAATCPNICQHPCYSR